MLRTLRPRRAFTLVEMLVVMALIIALAGIAVAVAESGAFGSQRVVSAADRASGWLLIAKQRAVRDGSARGVRFFRSPQAVANPADQALAYRFTEAQYIEQPDPWIANPAQEGNPTGPRIMIVRPMIQGANPPPVPSPPEVYFVSFDPALPGNPARQADMLEYDQRVGEGDYLFLPEHGGAFRILVPNDNNNPPVRQYIQVNMPGNPNPVQISPLNYRRMRLANLPDLAAANPIATTANLNQDQYVVLTTYKFAFQGQPRPLIGEPILQLTGNSCIDFRDQTPQAVVASGGGPVTVPNPYFSATNLGLLANNVPPPPPTSLGVDVTPPTNTAGPPGWEYFDILFTPTGQVLNPRGGLICLWVRDPDKLGPASNLQPHPRLQTQPAVQVDPMAAFDAAGEQVLVAIYTRTGLIATHPVSRPGSGPDPYTAAKDGINSGF